MWQILSSSLLSPWYPSEETLFCCWKKWPPNLRGNTHTHIHIHTHTHIQVNTYLHTHIQIHTYTHTHHNLQTSVVCEALARAPSGTCSFWGRKKRETRVTLGLFLPPLRSDTGDTAHVSLATMRHRGVEIQLFDEYYCLSTSFSGTPESSAVSFFSPWRSFWGTALCRDWTWSDPLRVGFEGIFYLAPLVCLWLLTPLQLVRMGLIRFVSPLPFFLPHSVSLTAGWYLLSSFYVSLLDLMEALKNKTQYLLPKNTT